jgi:hypothetical protein
VIEKKPLDDASAISITFVVPVGQVAGDVTVAGDFNSWDAEATRLRQHGDQLVASITLDAGRRYAFRYFGDGRWFNDDAADAYEPNEFGGYNCVIDLTGD